jgi:P4 family phage/plasmid primase-like protien
MGLFSIRYGLEEPVKVKEDAIAEYEELYQKINAPQEENTVVQKLPDGMEEWNDLILATVRPESEIAKAKDLILKCLSDKRANEFDSWMKVGWCIRNIDPSSEGFDLWLEFSKKSPKYNSNNVETLRRDWIRGSMNRIGEVKRIDFGSLIRWAKEDNLEKYNEIMNADVLNYIRVVALSFDGGTHHHVAEIMKRVFGDTYKCSVETRGHEWYRFVQHIWEPQPQGVELKKKMSDEIVDLVSDARKVYMEMARRAMGKNIDLEKEDELAKNCKKFLKLQLNLYSANYKDSCLKECIQTFYEESFAQKMNKNLYTVGCGNGVLHLRDPVYEADGKTLKDYTVTFKPGMPEDHISFQAGNRKPELDPLDYVPYDPENPEMVELLDFFEKIFPNAELREYILLLAASCLEGSNREQCYYIMTGSGGNGKSKFVDLMQNTFGDYCGSLSTAALTRKRPDSGAANPDIVNIKNKRFIAMQEPDEREQLNVARMKQFSGEDIVEARGLFKDQETFKITGKFFMSCNRLPPINSMDDGTWRRLRVIPFTSKFLSPGDPSIDIANGKYPRDPFLDDKLKRWRTTFFGYLVHLYKTKYMKEGIKSVPKEVKKYSDEYKQSYDSFSKFRAARVRDVMSARVERRAELLEEYIIFKQIKSAYRMWSNDYSSKPISENELTIRCHDAFGQPADGKTYKGIKLFNSDEEAEEWDNVS